LGDSRASARPDAGNLLVRICSAAQNYDFKTKKEAYFKGRNAVSSYALTSQVLGEDCWTPEVVEHRQHELLQILADCRHL